MIKAQTVRIGTALGCAPVCLDHRLRRPMRITAVDFQRVAGFIAHLFCRALKGFGQCHGPLGLRSPDAAWQVGDESGCHRVVQIGGGFLTGLLFCLHPLPGLGMMAWRHGRAAERPALLGQCSLALLPPCGFAELTGGTAGRDGAVGSRKALLDDLRGRELREPLVEIGARREAIIVPVGDLPRDAAER